MIKLRILRGILILCTTSMDNFRIDKTIKQKKYKVAIIISTEIQGVKKCGDTFIFILYSTSFFLTKRHFSRTACMVDKTQNFFYGKY